MNPSQYITKTNVCMYKNKSRKLKLDTSTDWVAWKSIFQKQYQRGKERLGDQQKDGLIISRNGQIGRSLSGCSLPNNAADILSVHSTCLCLCHSRQNTKKSYCHANLPNEECLKWNWEAFYKNSNKLVPDSLVFTLFSITEVVRVSFAEKCQRI